LSLYLHSDPGIRGLTESIEVVVWIA